MDNQPSFDRGILIPIGIAVFSLIGLCVVLVVGRITALRATVEEVPTSTSFQYSFIGTEPAVLTVTMDGSLIAPAPTEAPTNASVFTAIPLPTDITATSSGLRTNTPLVLATNARTPTSASTAPFSAGTYDTLDYRMVFSGAWTTQSGVFGAYQNTLHVSGTLGNSVVFRFIGQEVRLFFQAGPSLGTIRLTLDGTNYDMSEASSSTQIYEWVLPSVDNGTHTVTITHLSGGSVNLDYIIIPVVPVTPTNTATATQQ